MCQVVVVSTSCSDICRVNERRSEATCEGIGLKTISQLAPCADYRILNLRYNHFKHLEENSFVGFHHLTRVDLSSNHISEIDAGAFANASSLQEIHLIGVKLNVLKDFTFRGLHRLRELFLVAGKLEVIEENALSGLSSLIEIDISYTRLSSLPGSLFSDAVNLEIISLSHNKLETLPEDLFHGLENLRMVELVGNNLVSISANLFTNLPSLQEINLSSNRLNRAPAIDVLHLDLSHNAITEIHDLPSNISWRTLHLRGNRLHCDTAMEKLRKWYACQRSDGCVGDSDVDEWVCATPTEFENMEVDKIPSLTTTTEKMTTTMYHIFKVNDNEIPSKHTNPEQLGGTFGWENSSSRLHVTNVLSLAVALMICYATI